MRRSSYECPYCHRDLVEVDNPLRREFRHRRGEEAQCPGPEPAEGGGDGRERPFKPGDRVWVTDPGLAELRRIMRSAGHVPLPNHIGTVEDPDWGDHHQVLIVFDNEDGPGQGAGAPYPTSHVHHLPEPSAPVYKPWPWQVEGGGDGG